MHYDKTNTTRGNRIGLDQYKNPISFLADSFGESTSNIAKGRERESSHMSGLSSIQYKNLNPPFLKFATNLFKFGLG